MSRAPFAIACAAATAWILSRAWIADDAFITWRVIDNFVGGYGLRWNADERVQVFTHPLWALLHLPLYATAGSLPVASFVLTSLCLGLAGVLALRAAGADRAVFLLALVVPLAVSRAFADHVVSGLESPLVALCTAAFAAQALRASANDAEPPWLGLSLAASLLATSRPDSLLLILPASPRSARSEAVAGDASRSGRSSPGNSSPCFITASRSPTPSTRSSTPESRPERSRARDSSTFRIWCAATAPRP